MKVTIYIEGGGDSRKLKDECRKGFRLFLEKAGFAGKMPHLVACGSRFEAYDKFKFAIETAQEDGYQILLVDSEEAVTSTAWEHVENREGDQWEKPEDVDDDNLHFMVQCMEAWFLADPEALKGYFGKGFKEDKLPKNPNIEEVTKTHIYNGLKAATKETKTKGVYNKGSHSFQILERIAPQKVTAKSGWALRFLEIIRAKSDEE